MADQKVMKKRLKTLMMRPENQVCSDCPERQPRWASLIVPPPGAPPGTQPIGAFCCLECSGSHRRLGVHISFVRSINLDSWKEHEVRAMENGGNFKVNTIFEARLPSQDLKPTQTADGRTRERYIRDKYERRKYFDPAGYSSQEVAPVAEAPVSAPAPSVAMRLPSDAAKKRLEEHRARKTKQATSPPRPTQPAPAPVSAPVDLLDLFALEDAPAPAAQNGFGPTPHSSHQPQDLGKSSSLSDFLEADKKSKCVAETTKTTPLKPPGLDIMSLYNNNRSNGAPQSFANFGDTHGMQMSQQQVNMMGGIHGGGNNLMMTMNNQSGGMNNVGMPSRIAGNSMQQTTQMMHNMSMQHQPQMMQQQQMMMMNPQQQQQMYHQMMMMQQQQQQMYQQQMMMMQQHQQQQPTPTSMSTQQSSAKAAPTEKKDPFAHFAAF